MVDLVGRGAPTADLYTPHFAWSKLNTRPPRSLVIIVRTIVDDWQRQRDTCTLTYNRLVELLQPASAAPATTLGWAIMDTTTADIVLEYW